MPVILPHADESPEPRGKSGAARLDSADHLPASADLHHADHLAFGRRTTASRVSSEYSVVQDGRRVDEYSCGAPGGPVNRIWTVGGPLLYAVFTALTRKFMRAHTKPFTAYAVSVVHERTAGVQCYIEGATPPEGHPPRRFSNFRGAKPQVRGVFRQPNQFVEQKFGFLAGGRFCRPACPPPFRGKKRPFPSLTMSLASLTT